MNVESRSVSTAFLTVAVILVNSANAVRRLRVFTETVRNRRHHPQMCEIDTRQRVIVTSAIVRDLGGVFEQSWRTFCSRKEES